SSRSSSIAWCARSSSSCSAPRRGATSRGETSQVAVNLDDGAGQRVRLLVVTEESHRARHVVGGGLRAQERRRFLLHLRFDGAGRHAVDAHAERLAFDGEALGETDERELADGVRGEARKLLRAADAAERAHVDDGAAVTERAPATKRFAAGEKRSP